MPKKNRDGLGCGARGMMDGTKLSTDVCVDLTSEGEDEDCAWAGERRGVKEVTICAGGAVCGGAVDVDEEEGEDVELVQVVAAPKSRKRQCPTHEDVELSDIRLAKKVLVQLDQEMALEIVREQSQVQSEARDRALAERLALEAYQEDYQKAEPIRTMPSMNTDWGSRHRTELYGPFDNPTALYTNKLNLKRNEDSGVPALSLEEIASGRPTEILFAGGMVRLNGEQEYIGKFFPLSAKIWFLSSRCVLRHERIPWPFETIWVTVPLSGPPGEASLPKPKYKGGLGSPMQHSKLLLLKYNNFLRVAITSANAYENEWETVGQIIYCVDVPKKKDQADTFSSMPGTCQASSTSSSSPSRGAVENLGSSDAPYGFAQSLCAFLKAMFQSYDSEQAQHGVGRNPWYHYILEEYDFSVCDQGNVDLVASAPGIHLGTPLASDERAKTSKPSRMLWGLRKMRHALHARFPQNFFKTSDPVETYSSSVSLTWRLLADLVAALGGKDSLVNWGAFNVVFPSARRDESMLLADDKTIIPALSNDMRHLMHINPRYLSSSQPLKAKGLLREFLSCPAQRESRGDRVHHAKIMLRESQKSGKHKGKGWIYAGSHNLSQSAWGSGIARPRKPNYDKCKSVEEQSHAKKNYEEEVTKLLESPHKIRINHFELGVLLTNVRISDYEAVVPWARTNSQAIPGGLQSALMKQWNKPCIYRDPNN